MTPTATSVGACCSPPRTGVDRPAWMSRSVDLPGPVGAEGGPVGRAVSADRELHRERSPLTGPIGSRPGSCPHRVTPGCRSGDGSVRAGTGVLHGRHRDAAVHRDVQRIPS
ncbi:hypothetical protein ACFQ60_46560 [Streptomyces zhihengii]|uniref:Uncharacterized protein n=1 Tax=Streptomyces zhihengii TaxID=1818004 RepID=A0ABS2UHH7_9ACTN|nr:hypothetical protein [Streptomyces zhihengii]MBM9617136.1 hypothetical protein [Streptomyces zhihengii]